METLGITLDRDVEFLTLSGTSMRVRAGALGVEEESFVRLSVTTDVEGHARLREGCLFGLRPEVCLADDEMELAADLAVEVALMLRPELVTGLLAGGGEPAEVVAAALRGEDGAPAWICHEAAWLARSVTQRLPLSLEELEEDEGEPEAWVELGYQTRWDPDAAEGVAGSLLDVVIDCLDDQGWDYEEIAEDMLRAVVVADEERGWVVLIRADEEDRRCAVYSVFPDNAPEAKRAEVAAWLAEVNYEMAMATFDMDPADGEIRCRTSIDVEGDRLSYALFAQLVGNNLTAMAATYPEIAEHIAG